MNLTNDIGERSQTQKRMYCVWSYLYTTSEQMKLVRIVAVFRQKKTSLVAQLVKNPPAIQETLVWFQGWKVRWRRDRPPTPVLLGFPGGSAGKETACKAGDLSSIPGLGRSPGEGNSYPPQYSCLENSIDSLVLSVAKNQTQLSNFHFQLSFRE